MMTRDQVLALIDPVSLTAEHRATIDGLFLLIPVLTLPVDTDGESAQDKIRETSIMRLTSLGIMVAIACLEGAQCVEHEGRIHTGQVLELVKATMSLVIDVAKTASQKIDDDYEQADAKAQLEVMIEEVLARRSQAPQMNG